MGPPTFRGKFKWSRVLVFVALVSLSVSLWQLKWNQTLEPRKLLRSPRSNMTEKIHLPIFNGNHSSLPSSCVILRPERRGSLGIGDQLYRYAFACTVARDLGIPLYVVTGPRDLSPRDHKVHSRSFALHHFQLNSSVVQLLKEATFRAIPPNRTFIVEEWGPWQPDQLPTDKILVIPKEWQSAMYFGRYRNELVKQLVPTPSVRSNPRLQGLVQSVTNCESVSVHIRRGDFQGNEQTPYSYRLLPISYQLRAIELMMYLLIGHRGHLSSEVTFFVFSDDIEYARRELGHLNEISLNFVSDGGTALSSIEEFELMSMCRHNIIANSGFSWWTAWLNENPRKLVIAPFPRHRHRFYDLWGDLAAHKQNVSWNFTYPRTWITLNPYIGYTDMM